MVKSAKTGRPLTASFAKKIYPQYHTHGRWKKDDNVSMSEAKILEYFSEEIPFYRVPDIAKPCIMEAVRESHKKQLAELDSERTFLMGEITKNTNKLDGLIDMRVNGELNAEQFSKKQKEYVEKGVELEEKLSKILKIDNAILTSITESVEFLTNLDQFWKKADEKKKCQIIKMIAVELLIDEEKTLYIKENAVFEALRELNCSEWLGW